MKNLKKNAAAMLLVLFCAVFFGACTNSEDGMPTFTASQKTIQVPVEVKDTIWYPVHDTLTIEVIKKEGIKADGNPDLYYVDDENYTSYYPIIEDGEKKEIQRGLNVWAKIADCDHDIIVLTDSIIGAPRFSVTRNSRSYQAGDFTLMEFKAGWNYDFGAFSETVNTLHDKAWYKGWQMKSSYWTGGLKEVKMGKSIAYTHGDVEGRLFENATLTWEFVYNEDDVRTLTKTHKFFVANAPVDPIPEPDPEAKKVYGKNFEIKTTPENTAITTFEVWQELTNGKNEKFADAEATLRFWVTDAEGNVIDLNDNEEFSLKDLTPVEGTKTKVGQPRIYGNILIQEYVTTYTTKYAAGSQEKESVFYGHTEEATYIVPEGLGENIDFLHGDFKFKDLGTSKLQDMSDEGNFERKQSFSRIIAIYIDRTLDAEGSIILRKVTDEPVPEKKLTGYQQISWDDENSYVIRHFYDDNTYEDITVVDPLNCQGSLTMNDGTKIYRDNTNFGKPTIAKVGAASTVGSSVQSDKITRQQMKQTMKASFDGYAHEFEYNYTKRSYSVGNLKPIDLSVPSWATTHTENKPGTVRNEIESEKNYEVTPMSFIYSAAYGKNSAENYSHSFEVWKFVSEVSKLVETKGKDFGFDFVDARTSRTYFTAYNVMSDGTNVDLGTEEFYLTNYVENSARQIINPADNFDVTTATPVPGSKTYVSERTVNGKWGKAIIKLYRTTYMTATNKATTTFFMYHEEISYYPEKGDFFALMSKEYSAVDNGISALEDLGRKNGMDGKMYKSLVDFTFNGHTTNLFNEVELWVKTDNKNGIDIDVTNANAGAVHFWDPSNTHHISMTGVYNNKDGVGGIKGYSDGNLVIKATWDEVNKPTGRLSVAQDAGGTWYICQVSETSDKKGWIWRSIMKNSNGKAIRSVQKTELQVYGSTEVYINTSARENADGTVTLTAANGASVTLGAW